MRALDGGAALVISAVTGGGTAGDLQLAMDAGFDGHIVKPVDMPHLTQLLVLERAGVRAVNVAHRTSHIARSQRVDSERRTPPDQ